MACNQCYPTDFKNSYTKYKTNGYFPIVLMIFFELYMFELDLNTNLKKTVECFYSGQSNLCYIFFMKLHIMIFRLHIRKKTMIPNLKYVIKISIQMMNVHSYI